MMVLRCARQDIIPPWTNEDPGGQKEERCRIGLLYSKYIPLGICFWQDYRRVSPAFAAPLSILFDRGFGTA